MRKFPLTTLLTDNARSDIFCLLADNKTKKFNFQEIKDHLIITSFKRSENVDQVHVISDPSLSTKLTELCDADLITCDQNLNDLRGKLYSVNLEGSEKLRQEYFEMIGNLMSE